MIRRSRSGVARRVIVFGVTVGLALTFVLAATVQAESDLVGIYQGTATGTATSCPSGAATVEVRSVTDSTITVLLNGGGDAFAFNPVTETFSGSYASGADRAFAAMSGSFTRSAGLIQVTMTIDWHAYGCQTQFVGSTSAPSPTAAGSPGALTLGQGCATDLNVVRCTASVGGALPDADLVFEWLLDGTPRPEAGSTMQLDWVAEGVRTGSHTVLVTVRDARHPNVYPVVGSTSFELGLSVSLACAYKTGDGDYAVTCTATPSNAFATAVLEYDWSYSFLPPTGSQRNGTDGSRDERFSRTFGRGSVTVTVVARDTANGQQSSPVSFPLTIDPVATLTELLTGGETADPQSVIDALMGAGAGAAATAATILAALGLGGAAGAGTGSGGGTGAGAGAGGPAPKPGDPNADPPDPIALYEELVGPTPDPSGPDPGTESSRMLNEQIRKMGQERYQRNRDQRSGGPGPPTGGATGPAPKPGDPNADPPDPIALYEDLTTEAPPPSGSSHSEKLEREYREFERKQREQFYKDFEKKQQEEIERRRRDSGPQGGPTPGP
jgi:hypothetical protein